MNITELKELAEKASTGKWEHFILDKPLQEIPAYVKKCIDSSGGGEDFHFVIGTHPDGNPADICHVGNGVRSPQNAAFIAAANPAEILELIAKLEEAQAQMERQKDEWLSWEAKRRDLEKAAAKLEDAQGEIRALRDTKAGLVDRVRELESALQRFADTLYLLRRLLSNQHTLTGPEFREELTKIVETASTPAQPAQQERQIAEALRRHGLALVKKASGYDVIELGPATAQHQEPPQPVERKPMTDEHETRVMKLMGVIDDLIEADPDRAERLIESILARNALRKRLASRHHGIKE